jgi:hypothetical protein
MTGSTGTTSVSPKSKDGDKKKENKKSIKIEKAKEALESAFNADEIFDEKDKAITSM